MTAAQPPTASPPWRPPSARRARKLFTASTIFAPTSDHGRWNEAPEETMSADLFAEFSNLSQSTARNTAPAQEQWPAPHHQAGHMPQPFAAPTEAAADDDDGWGDFETAEPTAAAITGNVPQQSPAVKVLAQQPPPILKSTVMPSSRSQTGPKAKLKATPRDSNVLFDADDFELQPGEVTDDEDDEFGDFATAAQPSKTSATPMVNLASSVDLLGLEDVPQETRAPSPQGVRRETADRSLGALSFGALPAVGSQPRPAPRGQERSQAVDLPVRMSKAPSTNSKSKPNPAVSLFATESKGSIIEDGDDWVAWDDAPSPAISTGPAVDGAQPPDGWDWDADDGDKPSAADSSNDAPPINVPPPSVILSAFPELFRSGDLLFKPLAGQTASVKQQVLLNPRTVRFLQGYILLGTTAARVMVGRKHRWQRDKMLAKGMSLSAAGSKGMKLAGVDKTQSAREDREAADVVAAWREHVGRLRAAVATANSGNGAKLKIPELSDKMQIQTPKMVPTAPSSCVICGLKRDERILRVDFDVEDSFGEWWVEHWGHRACKNFWLEHEPRLRQR